MTDWPHDLRNQLNLMIYASAWARESLDAGRTQDASDALLRIDDAVTACVSLIASWEHELHAITPESPLPDQFGTGQAG